jgi:hypothetical protein
MKILNNIFSFLAVLLITTSCSDIIEPDITLKKVELKSPADGVNSETLTPTFSWYPLDGATKYNIQIATPSFAAVKTLYDTIITKTYYTRQLGAGKFEWRVRPVNNSYYGKFTDIRTLTIDSTLKIENQIVTIVSPSATLGGIDSSLTQLLRWNPLPLTIAKTYNLKITDADNVVTIKNGITDITYTYTCSKEGTYKWSVQAVNDNLETSKLSDVATFTIDRTAPSLSFTSALKDSVMYTTDSITFTWNSADANLLADSIVFYNEDSITINPTFKANYVAPAQKSFKFVKPAAGVYWIKIVAVDKAKNTRRTKKRKITVRTI